MFSEPQRTQYDIQFQLFGLPVRISPWFWVLAAILRMHMEFDDMRIWLIRMLCWMAAVFVSVLLHELGHALPLAYYFGARTWIVLHGFGGLACHDPYYRKRVPGTLGTIAYTAAGPGSGFLLVAVMIVLMSLCGVPWGIGWLGIIPCPQIVLANSSIVEFFINSLLLVSVFWGLLNLLPIYPLDGGHIAREILLAFDKRNGVKNSLWLSVFVGGGIAVLGLIQWTQGGAGGIPFMAILFGYLAYQSYQMLSYHGGFRY